MGIEEIIEKKKDRKRGGREKEKGRVHHQLVTNAVSVIEERVFEKVCLSSRKRGLLTLRTPPRPRYFAALTNVKSNARVFSSDA